MIRKAIIFMVLIIASSVVFYSLQEADIDQTNLFFPPKNFKVPLGLPHIPWPEDNPYSPEKAELGWLLYFDKRLSSDGTVSCGTCHSPFKAYTDHRPIAIGIHGHAGTRHTPTVINTCYSPYQFWDGRANSLEQQCKGPIGNKNEMTLAPNTEDAHKQCEDNIRKSKAITPYS